MLFRSEDIIFGLGPSIKACCFEVQEDVASLFRKRFGESLIIKRDGKIFVDLSMACLMQLKKLGIPAENITLSKHCTYCNPELFYSYRRDKKDTGAHASVIEFI